APVVGALARGLAGDPLGVARWRGDLAVERHRRLEEHPRPPGAGVLAERLVGQPRAVGELAARDIDLDPLVAQDAEPAAGGLLAGVVAGDDDAPDAGRDDRLGARRLLSLVAARLERDEERRAGEVGAPGRLDRRALGVQAAELLVPALAQHLAVA